MPNLVGAQLFFLGLASGVALFCLSSFRRVSPLWLRLLLTFCILLVIIRYITIACFTIAQSPNQYWFLRRFWFVSSLGITVPSVFAIDQLVRHPAMTPKKLLIHFSPFIAAFALVILAGRVTFVADPVAGWNPQLSAPWSILHSAVQLVFLIAFVGFCVILIRKIPSPAIRRGLAWLAAAHIYLGVDGLILALGGWYFRPFLYSEMFALLCVWNAFETGAGLRVESLS